MAKLLFSLHVFMLIQLLIQHKAPGKYQNDPQPTAYEGIPFIWGFCWMPGVCSSACLCIIWLPWILRLTGGYFEKKNKHFQKEKNDVPHSGEFRVKNLIVELADFKKKTCLQETNIAMFKIPNFQEEIHLSQRFDLQNRQKILKQKSWCMEDQNVVVPRTSRDEIPRSRVVIELQTVTSSRSALVFFKPYSSWLLLPAPERKTYPYHQWDWCIYQHERLIPW